MKNLDLLFFAHSLMAVLAVWRITDLFTQDRITEKLRKKFPTYLWQCSRCMSVWAAGFATVAFALFPWANWPFALAWLYLWHNETVIARRLVNKGRKFLVEVNQQGVAKWQNEFSPQELARIMGTVMGNQAANGSADNSAATGAN